MTADSARADLGYGRFASRYLVAVGVVLVAVDLLKLLWGVCPLGYIGSGLLFLLLGWQIGKGSNDLRKAAIVLCTLGLSISVVVLTRTVAAGKSWSYLRILGFRVENPSLALVAGLAVANVLVLAVPLAALLHPRTRRAFRALPVTKDPLDLSDVLKQD